MIEVSGVGNAPDDLADAWSFGHRWRESRIIEIA